MNIKAFLGLIILTNVLFANIQNKKYSISVCTTSTLEYATTCKKRIENSSVNNIVFIVKERKNRFQTYLGLFDSEKEANQAIKISSNYVKQQGPFSKEINNNIVNQINSNLPYIDINQNILPEEKIIIINDEPIAKVEEIKEKIVEDDSINQKMVIEENIVREYTSNDTNKAINNNLSNKEDLSKFEEIIIEVSSKTNMMIVKAKENNELTTLKTYNVSTGKNNIKKPKGLGKISEITLNPVWYPTQDTLNSFRKRGIYLPSVVPGGHKLNYMGAAKLNLTHVVDGAQTFRIHGTLNENTIGTNESAGCIRMKNEEVVQLANLLKDFSKYKSMNDITVKLD
ncbi:L,D-transpeptidase [Aliarcobacter cibarius]|jgi:lipoprotein-anchoring transpeptidase ErfK/SrfK|uniref:L,D-transpeptidase n=1 Tax=Aliarcobacter cibarius TaxID=255507 RepID=A0ABY2V7Y1_9BACT|nr:L,D-transpeptidase [Aliarcobacter cibarius]TLS96671.1 L,D-transpeptidase [Aliarcobacter cibarius]TLS97216.1 L,D-transpeptidase [Aliarcobacter cibarius]